MQWWSCHENILMDPRPPNNLSYWIYPQRNVLSLRNHAGKKLTVRSLSERKPAPQHDVPKTTLQKRINGSPPASVAYQRRQCLVTEEETALVNWILRLQAWGWPARVEQTRQMAQELLTSRGSTHQLGNNWQQKFLKRHPDIKMMYIPPLDKERALA